jgi:iron complex transport system substrate-binding protein
MAGRSGGMKRWIVLLACHAVFSAKAAISLQDDAGVTVTLAQPAQRIVSLSPHVTELLFAAGAGGLIVGTVNYSDYPAAARSIPRVGDNRQVDIERIVAMKPDLLVVWRHNASARQMEQLRALGIPLFYSEPHKLEDIPETLLKLGRLAGTEERARQNAGELRRTLADLGARYSRRPLVRVFYQVWDRPLYTLNDKHIVNDAIRLCGGENIFAKLPVPAPTVTVEAVLQEDPEAIVSGERQEGASGLDHWKKYANMTAVRRGNLIGIDRDLLNLPGPRIVNGAAALCDKLEQVRNRRGEKP